jgi:amino acid adenylation domain-containing protein
MRASLNLAAPFVARAAAHPHTTAVRADDRRTTYLQLADRAGRIAAWLASLGLERNARVALLAKRGPFAYAGILGACTAGAAYVPLAVRQPSPRLAELLRRCRPHAILVDADGALLLDDSVLSALPKFVLLADDDRAYASPTPSHFVAERSLDALTPMREPAARASDDPAYLMFTSGTTGVPKGVVVTTGNVARFLSFMQERYRITPEDRLSQFFELTFDLSVFDMFMTWGAGASLYVVPDGVRMAPADFIRERELSIWFSVPSTAVMLQRLKKLAPGAFPRLRLSLFCGEPLPESTAHHWRAAAPNSVVENLYGPTEATVACLLEPCTESVAVTPERGVVAIGRPYDGTRAAIVGPDGRFLAPNSVGELALGGEQVSAGYWENPELTAQRFPLLTDASGAHARWYLTGDLARMDADGRFHHLGRIDNQVKISGYRVELEEVEAHLRAVTSSSSVAAVAWPVQHGSAQGIVGFVTQTLLSPAEVREGLKGRAPDYMIPRRILVVEKLPETANGKTDRKALLALLESGAER